MFNGHASSEEHDSGVGIYVQHLCMLTACASHLLTFRAEMGRSGGEVALKPIGCGLGIGLLGLLTTSLILFELRAKPATSLVKHCGESVVRLYRNERVNTLRKRERHSTQERGRRDVAFQRLSHGVHCLEDGIKI